MKEQRFLVLGLVLSMCTWGMSWPSGKILSSYASPAVIALFRFAVTCFGLLPILLLSKNSLRVKTAGIPILLAAGCCMSLYSYLFFKGLLHGLPGAGGVLVTTLNPIFAYGLGLILTRKKPKRNELLGLLLGVIAGIILLKFWGNPHFILDAGNIFFLLASITWALLSKLTSQSSKYSFPPTFSFWIYIVCSFIMFVITPLQAIKDLIVVSDSKFWYNIFFSGVITTSLATTFYFFATSKLGAEKASSFIFLVPVSAALSSFIFLDEIITWNTIVGGLFGILAVLLINSR